MAKKYDVFISFKNTDPKGGLTVDRTIAQRLHDKLLDEGLNVFFSEKDLSDTEFMNQIYTALDEADLLIVVGTNPEYVRSTWVKSEWTNYLGAINSGRKPNGKIMTVLSHMTTYDLPLELSNFQSFDASSLDDAVAYAFRTLGRISNSQAREWEKAENERKLKEAEQERLKAVKAQMEAERREKEEREKLEQANRKAADAARKASDEEKKRLAAEEKAKKQFATKNSKIKRLSMPMIALLCVVIGGLLIGFVVMKALSAGKVDTVDSIDETVSSSADEDQTSSQDTVSLDVRSDDFKTGNSAVNRYIYQYGDFIYYSDYDTLKLKAYSLDCSQLVTINETENVYPYSLSFYKTKICYTNMDENIIYVYDIDRNQNLKVLSLDDKKASICCFYEKYLYYVLETASSSGAIDTHGLYCYNIETGGNEMIYNNDSDNCYIFNAQVYKNKLYAIISNIGLVSMDLDGKNVNEIIDESGGSFYFDFAVHNDFIYLLDTHSGISRYDLNGGNKETIVNEPCDQMDIYENKIYYSPKSTSVSENNGVCGIKCTDLNGNNVSIILEKEGYGLTVCAGNWIYSCWPNSYYRIRLDGTGLMKMP